MPTTCFVSYEIHPTTPGGCGVLIHHAADRLLASGHTVVLLLDVPADIFTTFADRDRLTFAFPERCRAFRVDDLCADFPYTPTDIPNIFLWKSLRFRHALERLERLVHIDCVEFFEYCGPGYATFAARLFEPDRPRPVLGCRVHSTIELLDRCGDGLVRDESQFTQHAIERAALSLSEFVLVPTRTYYEEHYRARYRIPEQAVVVSPPPKQAFPVRARQSPADGSFSIAFIGRLFHIKGADQLVHAAVMLMKRRPDARFTVDLIGYDSPDGPLGSYEAYLRTLIPERLRDRFQFTGQLTHDQIADRLARARFAVFPNRIESFCYALHEAYDSGIPVIINDLPAFRDFFTHDRNALVYDGSTAGLLHAMMRLVDDDSLAARLSRPYPVAQEALGGFYEAPSALSPLAPAANGLDSPTLVVVLCPPGPASTHPCVRALAGREDARVVALVPSDPDGEETLWWLGRPWHARDARGERIEPSDVLTTGTLAVLSAADRPHEHWLTACRRALSRRAHAAFAGTWTAHEGRLTPGMIDLTPELSPFTTGAELQRVVVRTRPGTLLGDVLDSSLQELGHLGLLWRAIGDHGPGVLYPEPLLDAAPTAKDASPRAIQALLLRHGAVFGDRLGLVLGLLPATRAEPSAAPDVPAPGAPDIGVKIAIAEELGGRTLAKLAWRKLARRVGGVQKP